MKKLLSFLLALALLIPLPGAKARAEEDVTEIYDLEGFLSMADAPYGSYRLMVDLDLGALDWEPFAFYGVLYGGGHGLYNLTVRAPGAETRSIRDGRLIAYDAVFAGLFSTLENAEIRDLQLLGADISLETEENCFAAILAGYLTDSVIRNCSVSGHVRMISYGNMGGVGGVAGYGCGAFDSCGAEVELFYEDRFPGLFCEQFMGGILACGIAHFTSCTVWIDGYDSCHGFVHNGGLLGMYYPCGMEYPMGPITDNVVHGQISFFEDNPSGHGYCDGLIGELLCVLPEVERNTRDFRTNQVRDYRFVLSPEVCEEPDYVQTVTPPRCGDEGYAWGYTTHSCSVCGYSWRDSYTPPHSPGDWELARLASYDSEGLLRQRCALCGEVLAEQTVPALVKTQSCQVSPDELRLFYKDTNRLSAVISPEDAESAAVVWTTSDPEVVTVDETGLLYAAGRGTARVICRSADGFSQGECAVTVDYSVKQWLIVIFLFGWLWY